MAPIYLTKEQREEALAEADRKYGWNRAPSRCPGFRFELPDILRYGEPLEDIHFDGRAEKPVTILCSHGERANLCQWWAEYAYILILAYVKGEIGNWKMLFPNYDTPMFRGKPHCTNHHGTVVDNQLPSCAGFALAKGPGTRQYDLNVPNMIRMTYDVDPVTLAPYTKMCRHFPCSEKEVWKWALFRAFALNMLEEIGFDNTDEEPLKGMYT